VRIYVVKAYLKWDGLLLDSEVRYETRRGTLTMAKVAAVGADPVVGIALGILQILLSYVFWFNEAELPQRWQFVRLPAVALCVLLYLLIPALVGFLTPRRGRTVDTEHNPGCLVGGIGFLVIAAVALVWYDNTTASMTASPACSQLGCAAAKTLAEAVVEGEVVTILLFEGVVAVIGGLLGGGIGKALGRRRAAASKRSNRSG
jgi:hypothetical protein